MNNKLNLEEAIKQNNYLELSNYINESINQTVDGMNLEELIRETESENTPVVNSGACKN